MPNKERSRKRAKPPLRLVVHGPKRGRSGRSGAQTEGFFAHPTFNQLARQQAIGPFRDPSQLGGVLPDDFDVEEMVAEIDREGR